MKEVTYNIKFLNGGFFGSGDSVEFTNFSLAHFMPIIVTILIILLIKKNADKIRNFKYENEVRFFYGFSTILVWVSYFFRLLFAGPQNHITATSFISQMPFQVCDLTLMVCAIAMMKKSPRFFQAGFILTMSTTIPALIIPGTVLYTCGPTRYRYYQYFAMHLMPVISVYYMMFVYKWKVNKKYILVDACILFVHFLFCLCFNSLLIKYGYEPTYMYMNIASKFPWPKFLDNYIGLFLVYCMVYFPLSTLTYFIYSKLNKQHLDY